MRTEWVHNLQVLREALGHVHFPKYISFAACDTCVHLKDRVRLATDERAQQSWRDLLTQHRDENEADRKMYHSTMYALDLIPQHHEVACYSMEHAVRATELSGKNSTLLSQTSDVRRPHSRRPRLAGKLDCWWLATRNCNSFS